MYDMFWIVRDKTKKYDCVFESNKSGPLLNSMWIFLDLTIATHCIGCAFRFATVIMVPYWLNLDILYHQQRLRRRTAIITSFYYNNTISEYYYYRTKHDRHHLHPHLPLFSYNIFFKRMGRIGMNDRGTNWSHCCFCGIPCWVVFEKSINHFSFFIYAYYPIIPWQKGLLEVYNRKNE